MVQENQLLYQNEGLYDNEGEGEGEGEEEEFEQDLYGEEEP